MSARDLVLRPVGVVRSELRDRDLAPMQGTEGAPDAWIELRPEVLTAASSLAPGDELLVLTWLHRPVGPVQPGEHEELVAGREGRRGGQDLAPMQGTEGAVAELGPDHADR
ncbi:MAG TPA: hypothetical protein VFD38_09525, partial [Myxococcaceae bacterium]|nr:hypothetical protein [Myxococcaceae bacterium]